MPLTTTASAPAPAVVVRLASGLDRCARMIEGLAMVVSALAIAVTTLIVCAEVVLRTGFGISTLISAEYAGYLLVTTVYLGLAWTFRSGGFIRVELLHSLIAGRLAALVNTLIAGFAAATLMVYTWYIFGFVATTQASGATSIYVTRTPLWIPMAVMPVGSALLTWAMLAAAVRAAVAAIWPDTAPDSEIAAEDWL